MDFILQPAWQMTIGIANLPNQKHRKVAKRGERFNLLIVGASRRDALLSSPRPPAS